MKPARVIQSLCGFIAGVVLLAAAPVGRVLAEEQPSSNGFGTVFQNTETTDLNAGTTNLPVLTTPEEVRRLKREEAARGYPVKMQGVVICVVADRHAFVLQAASNAVWAVNFSTNTADLPRAGEFLNVEGVTDKGSFAPIVRAGRVTSLGLKGFPEPILPAWDQLMNGSLDDQFVELRGLVENVADSADGWAWVVLRTPGGTIWVNVRMDDPKVPSLKPYENALVRLRGCLFVVWDVETHQLKARQIRVAVSSAVVEQAAPEDLFNAPQKSAAELLQFDPQASAFQRVVVTGQVVHVRGLEYFTMNGSNGVRFVVKQPSSAIFMMDGSNAVHFLAAPPEKISVGDTVKVVGFPELNGGAPVLDEAVAHRTGLAALPAGRRLDESDLMRASNDATRVRVDALLTSVKPGETNQVLELQSGSWRFLARLDGPDELVKTLRLGSRLELTGVYDAGGGNRLPSGDVTPFDLLLNSSADIKILAQPPWWTLKRLLVVVGALMCVLAAAALWISQLRRQVGERTAQLEVQIKERQRVESQRAMEQERARVAQDLHDELGSGLTEISMLAFRAKSEFTPEEKRAGHLAQVGDRAGEMVASLDEIVWAMNPKHDSFASLVSYFCLYAERFLGLANIAWHLEQSSNTPADCPVDSQCRHQLFLAFKEALNNIVRHSGATEVRLDVQLVKNELRLAITDNGRGLPVADRTEEMDGVANMRGRIEKLGGRFEIASANGGGTTLRFGVPVS
jgi:signal transduction histidine kinase